MSCSLSHPKTMRSKNNEQQSSPHPVQAMRCPACGFQIIVGKISDSRREKDYIRRRRTCSSCGVRFTTREYTLADIEVLIAKEVRKELRKIKLSSWELSEALQKWHQPLAGANGTAAMKLPDKK